MNNPRNMTPPKETNTTLRNHPKEIKIYEVSENNPV